MRAVHLAERFYLTVAQPLLGETDIQSLQSLCTAAPDIEIAVEFCLGMDLD